MVAGSRKESSAALNGFSMVRRCRSAAGPAVLSRPAVADDLAVGRLRAITVAGLDLHRQLQAIWVGGRTPPAGAVRDLLSQIISTQPTVNR